MRSLLPFTLLPITLALPLLLLDGCATQPSTTFTSAEPTAATERVVIRPVTAAGLPAPGFSVTEDTSVTVDCGATSLAPRPSPVAVDDDILACLPSSAYAVACWPDPSPSSVVCYGDPWEKSLVRMPTVGSVPAVSAPPQAQALGLLLSDGDRCRIRSGGVWNDLVQHTGWYGTYSCEGGEAIWAESADGVDRSSPRWTVEVAPISGAGPLRTRGVATAYFVGTQDG